MKTYAYDDAFRITGITDTTNSALTWTYGYDDLDRLTSASKTGTTLGYTYDANGNRLAQTGTSASTYTVAANSNRLSSTTGALALTYGYNAAGSTTSFTGITFAYNNRGRMKRSTKGGVTTAYTYNALGQLIKKGTTALYHYDEAGHILGIHNGSGALTEEIVWLGDTPVASLRPKTGGGVNVFYIHTDHLNAPRLITQPSNNALRWRWDAHPFGSGSTNENPSGAGQFVFTLRFPGQMYVAETGLYYNYYRDYDPATGRYVESDPIGLKGGVNTYAYVRSSPLDKWDVRGLESVNNSRAFPSDNTIICDGFGGIEIVLTPLLPLNQYCGIGACIWWHERVHLSNALRRTPGVCSGKPRGLLVEASNENEQNEGEAEATKAELECLQQKLDQLSGACHMCEEPLRKRIEQQRRYLSRARRYEL